MRILSLAMLAFGFVARGVPADEVKPITVHLSWRIAIDAQGHVTQIDAANKQPIDKVPQIRARLEKEIRGWQFDTGSVNGRPAPTETGLHVTATLIPKDKDSLEIRVNQAGTGANLLNATTPKYPPNAVMKHETGQVVLRIGYDASGRVTSATLDPGAPAAPLALVKASITAAQTWAFRPETVAGHAIAGYAITPFCYRIAHEFSSRVEGKCDWKRPDTAESVGEGQALAVNPAARLQTEVSGRAL